MSLSFKKKLLVVCLGLGVVAAPAFADKPEWAGNQHEKKMQKEEQKRYKKENKRHEKEARRYGRDNPYFSDRHRQVISGYYDRSYRAGRCPPGLAKKHNGCLPPGHAKRYDMYQPLPRGVTYYSVPRSVIVDMGPPPVGYRYVRVDSDILLMEIGTRIVVDAIMMSAMR